MSHRWKGFAVAALLVTALSSGRIHAESADAVKAAFLYNFAKFTEWPASAFPDASSKVIVGFVGGAGLAETFSQNVTGRNVNGHEFSTKNISAAEAANCHIVYVSDSGQADAVLSAVKGKAILTVGEGDAFLAVGGAIAFQLDGPRVVFDINLAPAKAAGLALAAKLQKVARSVRGQ